MTKIDYGRLIDTEKRRAFFAGRIHTYNEIIKLYRRFMSGEFLTVMQDRVDELTATKQVVKDQIKEVVSSPDTDSLEECSEEEVA